MGKEVCIVVCGQAGQGIKTIDELLTSIFHVSGFNVFSSKEYMSRIRGGMNSTQIRVSTKRVRSPLRKADILITLHKGGVAHAKKSITGKTVILGGKDAVSKEELKEGIFCDVPWKKLAEEIGDAFYANVIAAGVVAGLLGCEEETVRNYIADHFASKGGKIQKNNVAAVEKGFEKVAEVREKSEVDFTLERAEDVSHDLLMNGTAAVAYGAIAGGCNFLSFYPMSPSTGVGVTIARHAGEFGIVVEQAEDEIAAFNMCLGAWYAGARALVTTSGGGFALMVEGLSLAGMIESPAVIHLGQRPGPATGLPTRTEQGDLLFSLFAGHGEFPRVIYAPATIEQAFSLSFRAFETADKFQVPVIILTDQYLLDSYYNLPRPEINGLGVKKHVVQTDEKYRRYVRSGEVISPRGIPRHGNGVVVVDSDEHDQEGHITEDLALRIQMVDKRCDKLSGLEDVDPVFQGKEDCHTLVVGWGSTYHVIEEALEEIGREGVGHLHVSQVYPLPGEIERCLENAKKTICIENNATGQFSRLVRMFTGREFDSHIRKYNGLPFFKDELARRLRSEVRG